MGVHDDDKTLPSTAREQPAVATFLPVDPGHYDVERELARGGMGRIRIARDRRLGRPVALKELLVAATPEAKQRFEYEARITARLQHPSIVNVHEAGVWPSGEPFYTMSLVAGRSLDEAIRAAPTLDGRLALVPHVLAAADAMAWAHGERVIHRDLKPSNILVGNFGETVVIDWGLAKSLDDREPATPGAPEEPSVTQPGAVMGTPAFMSPEQAWGRPVDARTDVYALGAILECVLAGRTVSEGSPLEVLAAVRAGPPPPLAQRQRGVPTELLAIVDRAMAREPADRYPTAREFSTDVRRFLNGQLVGAHHYSRGELFTRWLKRNRALITMAVVALTIIAVIGVASLERIFAAQARAETSRDEAERLIDLMLGNLHDKLEPIGRVDLLKEVASSATQYYQRNAPGPRLDARRQRGRAHRQLGQVLLVEHETLAAAQSAREAIGLLEPLTDDESRNELAQAFDLLGTAVLELRRSDEALHQFTRSLAIRQALVASAPANGRWQNNLAVSHNQLGLRLIALRRYREALEEFEAGLRLLPAVRASQPADEADLLEAVLEEDVGTSLIHLDRRDDARRHAQTAVGIFRRLLGQHPLDTNVQSRLASALEVASSLPTDAEGETVLAELTEARELRERLSSRDPLNLRLLRELAHNEQMIGIVMRPRDPRAAVALLERAGTRLQLVSTVDPQNAELAVERLDIARNLGDALTTQHEPARALGEYESAAELGRALRSRPELDGKATDLELARVLLEASTLLKTLGRRPEALERAREARNRLVPWAEGDTAALERLASAWETMGELQSAQKDLEGAVESMRQQVATYERILALDRSTNTLEEQGLALAQLGVALEQAAHHDEAVRQALAACRELEALSSEGENRFNGLVECHKLLGMDLRARKDPGANAELRAALSAARRLVELDPADEESKQMLHEVEALLRR